MKPILTSIIVLALLILATSVASAAFSSFNGAWRSIDYDSSHQQMNISSGEEGTFTINFIDHAANFCGGLPIIGKGTGQVGSDGVLHTALDVRCLGGLEKSVDDVDYWLTYDAEGDTLTDAWGIT